MLRATLTRSIIVAFVAVLTGLGLLAGTSAANAAPLKPVPSLDVQRYLGTWWQLATVPSLSLIHI